MFRDTVNRSLFFSDTGISGTRLEEVSLPKQREGKHRNLFTMDAVFVSAAGLPFDHDCSVAAANLRRNVTYATTSTTPSSVVAKPFTFCECMVGWGEPQQLFLLCSIGC